AVVVVVDRLGDDQGAVGIAQTVQVEVRCDHLRVQRAAVGEGDVLTQGEGVLGGVVVHLPVRGQPWFEFQGLGVLVDEPVGDVVDQSAVGVEACFGRVESVVCALVQVDEGAAGLRFTGLLGAAFGRPGGSAACT